MSSLLKRFAAGVSAVALTGSGLAYAQSDGDADGESQDIDTIDVIGTLADHNSVSALPVQVLSGDALANRRQGGLGETLAGLPASISTVLAPGPPGRSSGGRLCRGSKC